MDILSILTDLGSSFETVSGPMNRVFDIKSGHDFCRYRNSIQVFYFQINGEASHIDFVHEKRHMDVGGAGACDVPR